ncbi:hypothetical protein Dimus_016064 [Dionaea muscipula]
MSCPMENSLPGFFEAFHVPLNYKKGEDPKSAGCNITNDAPAENVEGNQEANFEWEAMNDEAEIQGEQFVEKEVEIEESGSGEMFYDAEDGDQGSADVIASIQTAPAAFPASPTDSSNIQQKETTVAGVDPLGPVGSIPYSIVLPFQPESEGARAERIQAELDQARAENARLQALLHQAPSQQKP